MNVILCQASCVFLRKLCLPNFHELCSFRRNALHVKAFNSRTYFNLLYDFSIHTHKSFIFYFFCSFFILYLAFTLLVFYKHQRKTTWLQWIKFSCTKNEKEMFKAKKFSCSSSMLFIFELFQIAFVLYALHLGNFLCAYYSGYNFFFFLFLFALFSYTHSPMYYHYVNICSMNRTKGNRKRRSPFWFARRVIELYVLHLRVWMRARASERLL